MSPTLQILSDLHLEAPQSYDVFSITPRSRYLALLGDVGCVKDASYFTFIDTQLSQFDVVFLVLGNHEPYHSDWARSKARVREFEREVNSRARAKEGDKRGRFVLLDQTRYDLSPDLTILGCTLFSHIPAAAEESVSFGINDFYYTGDDWSVATHNAGHASDLAWLNAQTTALSAGEPERRIIVLTHYSPTTAHEAIDPAHGTNSKISSGFATDLSREACWLSENVKLWAFGHTHFNCDFVDEPTGKRVLANQRGYYFKQAVGFDAEKCVALSE